MAAGSVGQEVESREEGLAAEFGVSLAGVEGGEDGRLVGYESAKMVLSAVREGGGEGQGGCQRLLQVSGGGQEAVAGYGVWMHEDVGQHPAYADGRPVQAADVAYAQLPVVPARQVRVPAAGAVVEPSRRR